MPELLDRIPKEWLEPDAVLPLPSRAQFVAAVNSGEQGLAALEKVLRDRAEALRLRRTDPLRYSFQPDCARDFRKLIADGFDEIYVTGANREGKTFEIDRFIVEDLFGRKCEWAMFHNTQATSQHQQQKRIFEFFPPDLRAKVMAKPMKRMSRLGAHANPHGVYLSYNPATGFSNDNFILPHNGSHAFFFNYGQSTSVWEGPEYDGMMFEEAVTLDILETSRFRRGKDRRLLMIVNFTPKWGFTPVVQNLLAGAKIVETRRAYLLDEKTVHVKGCPPGHMPYIMHGAKPGSAIIFFHNGMNPLGAGREVLAQLVGAPKSRVLMRGYGWAEKGESNAFPKFGPAHIITRKRFEQIAQEPGTWYCVTDPGSSGKNWFFQWWFATHRGHHILAKEWPDLPRYEEWAVSPAQADASTDSNNARRHDWRRGPAQRIEAGRSIASYKSLILTEEGWRYTVQAEETNAQESKHGRTSTARWVKGPAGITVYRRLMDPAYGGSEVPSAEEGATPIQLMAEKGQRDSDGREVPAMDWEQASRGSSGSGTGFKADRAQMLADWMDWDETKPLTAENCPRMYVVEDCHQSITAFREYVSPPWSSSRNALCEPIDCAGYYAKSDCRYIDAAQVRVKRGGWW